MDINYLLNETTNFLRDLKLSSILQDSNIELKVNKKSKLSFGYKKINELNKMGGIISGSKALTFYHIDGVPLLSKKVNNWEIIIDDFNFNKFSQKNIKESDFYSFYDFYRFSSGFPLIGLKLNSKGISISKKRKYLFKNNFDVFVEEKLPNYTEVDGYKISSLEFIMSRKLEIIKKWVNNGYILIIKNYIDEYIEVMTKIKANIDPMNAINFICNPYDTNKGLYQTQKGFKDILSILNAKEKKLKND